MGDNLGVNCTCGFSKNFIANYYCQICRASSAECKEFTKEVKSLLRTKESYETDVKVNDASLKGMNGKCVFNQLDNFHMVENQSIGIMHDIFEGVAGYTIGNIFYALIYEEKLFTLDMLNHRIETFNYGELETKDKSRRVTLERCKDSKTKGKKWKIRLKQSSGEMMCLSRYLGLIVRNFVPVQNQYWTLYLISRKIIGIVTAPRIVEGECYDLEELIRQHNSTYKSLFGHLKPKMHLMTHYPRILLENGPLIHFWGMPYERKNKQLKDIAVAIKSTKNVPFTIAIRNQLQLCYL